MNDIAIDATLSALADPVRRQVVELLRERPRRAGELARSARVSPPLMSRHLRVLRATGLVEAGLVDDDARFRVYHLRPEPFLGIRAWLDHFDAYWASQLDAFKEHAERTAGSGSR